MPRWTMDVLSFDWEHYQQPNFYPETPCFALEQDQWRWKELFSYSVSPSRGLEDDLISHIRRNLLERKERSSIYRKRQVYLLALYIARLNVPWVLTDVLSTQVVFLQHILCLGWWQYMSWIPLHSLSRCLSSRRAADPLLVLTPFLSLLLAQSSKYEPCLIRERPLVD